MNQSIIKEKDDVRSCFIFVVLILSQRFNFSERFYDFAYFIFFPTRKMLQDVIKKQPISPSSPA